MHLFVTLSKTGVTVGGAESSSYKLVEGFFVMYFTLGIMGLVSSALVFLSLKFSATLEGSSASGRVQAAPELASKTQLNCSSSRKKRS